MRKKNKIIYKPSQGLLLNNAGCGMVGIQGIVFSAVKTIPVTNSTTTTLEVTLPANALILDVGWVTTTALDADTGTTISLSFGTTSGGAEITASAQLNQTNTDIAAGTSVSSVQGNLVHASGNAVGAFKAAAPLYAAANRTIYGNVTIGGAEMAGAGAGRIFVKYTLMENTY